MGGFHLICACSKQFSRDLKVLESLFVYSGINGEGTIEHALKGGAVKFSIHLHELMFEAIIRTKIYLEISGLFSIDKIPFRTLSTFKKTFRKKFCLSVITELTKANKWLIVLSRIIS